MRHPARSFQGHADHHVFGGQAEHVGDGQCLPFLVHVAHAKSTRQLVSDLAQVPLAVAAVSGGYNVHDQVYRYQCNVYIKI
jgi:hypothetical protein